jgi:Sec-independent protein translocase protein TatA
MFGLGVTELLALLAIGLLWFGNRLPDLTRSLGKMVVEFRKEFHGLEDEVSRVVRR